tara:strand:+ start:3370 stop:3720 length:351 start_codon:yes stop_codon:yes gene_type:complete
MGGFFGGIGGQISDTMWRGPQIDTHDLKFPDFFDQPGKPMPDVEMPSPPGYQMPTPGLPDPKPPEGNQQYFLQMRQSIESLGEALKQIEGMQTPGGKYQSGNAQMTSPGGSFSAGK